jgi:magnesium chelatase family protein
MLARRLPTVLPPLDDEESLDVTAIHSVAGLLGSYDGLVSERPFRAPHHTASAASLLGGGDPIRPGEMSLAHHGVLFLDELLEFRRHVLEGMRQPLEDGEVTICRAKTRATFPARPLLIAAVNPCPCGHHGSPLRACRCTPTAIASYQGRLSGPLIDRIDLRLQLAPVALDQLTSIEPGESSGVVAKRVAAARAEQRGRAARGETHTPYNAALSQLDLERVAPPCPKSRALLRCAVERGGLSARGYVKIWRMARSIADVEGSDAVREPHFAEAVQARAIAFGRPIALARAS